MRSLLIVNDYFQGKNNAVFGVFLQRLTTSDKMVSIFKDYEILNNDAAKSAITIQNMLTMSAGLDWDEWSVPYGNTGNSLTDMYNSTDDYISYILNKPVIETPGTKFTYNSGISFLLGAVLQTVSNEKVENNSIREKNYYQRANTMLAIINND